MLTSLFYYDHYRPYIMNKSGEGRLSGRVAKNAEARRRLAEDKGFSDIDTAAEVSLNKALNKEVVNYAKNIYKNTTDLKYTSKKIVKDLRNYAKYKNREDFDQENFEQSFDKDVAQFARSYNKSMQFLKEQPHSPFLGAAAGKLEEITDSSGKILSVIGVKKDEEGVLEADEAESTFWNGKNTEKKFSAATELFDKMHKEASNMLGNPMSMHMNFKSLNYYYNYEVDKVRVDSFQIIKTGLLVNLAL